jgi:hypothetical protein
MRVDIEEVRTQPKNDKNKEAIALRCCGAELIARFYV